MKPTLPLLLSFLFLILSPNLTLKAAAGPVLDINGNGVLPGVRYYIVSASGEGGGLILNRGFLACPFTVIQSPREYDYGNKWTFEAILRRAGPIQTSDPVLIRSEFAVICLRKTYWTVSSVPNEETGLYFINAADSGVSIFQIQSAGTFAYSFVYARPDHPANVVVQDVDGLRHLVVSNETISFPVVFIKADDLKRANLQRM